MTENFVKFADMINCCTTIDDLGCSNNCDDIDVGANYAQTGTHTIELQMPSNVYTWLIDGAIGNPITLPNKFNEDMLNVFRIKQPDGTYLGDCYQIEIMPTFADA